MTSHRFWLFILVANLAIINVALAFFFFRKPVVIEKQVTNYYPVSTIEPQVVTATPKLVATQPQQVTDRVLTKKTTYIPIPGSGSKETLVWFDVPGTEFYFDQSDFSNIVMANFEANFRLFNGNGQAFVRLFDVTNGVEIWGSELSTSSQSFVTLVSPPLTFRNGNNLIRIQIKSLTSDTTVYNSGRLKIVTKD